MERTYDIFVPGRVCLFGEHSDWAGGYRRINSALEPGRVMIAGTNQGTRARTKAHPNSLVFRPCLPDGSRPAPLVVPMDKERLLQEAAGGGFFSYAAGVAYMMSTFYRVQGIDIDNYETTLPIKKGLSSSAAVCVLVARAFNKVYDLKLTVRAEMEIAYQGEILTPSRCGRMDQGCAFGQVPVLMTFDGELVKTKRLAVKEHIPLLIADLKGEKDTIKILGDLNRAYPFAGNDNEEAVQRYLGPVNVDLLERAATAVAAGDAESLGRLMTEAQEAFDRHLIPACPDELAAPKLHKILADETVKACTFGGKGVGSQGDGCVQFVTKDVESRRQLGAYLTDTYGLDCFELDLTPPQTVRKALIPAAGFGTRMFPASKATKKELFPVVTSDGIAKPVILAIIEEAVHAGIEEIGLIVRPGDESLFQSFFHDPLAPEHYNRLSEKHKAYFHWLQELGDRITFIPQETQEGFGHAVYCARDWVEEEPVLLMLGDHLYVSNSNIPCARQLIDAYDANGRKSVIGLYVADAEEVSHYGTVTGQWTDDERHRLEITALAEKPSREYAEENLLTPGLPQNRFLCLYGQYVLNASLFEELENLIAADRREGGEIQLTTALDMVRKKEGISGCRIDGQHYDTGLPGPYIKTLQAVYRGESAERAGNSEEGAAARGAGPRP